jgi:cobalt-zinc-cadmium efflux system outer membrane protein
MVAAADEAQRVLELAVATAFWEALAADKLVAVLEESRSLFETLNETARLRLERGEATPLEQNTARVRLAEAERRLASAKAQRVSATLRLMELLAMPLATPVIVRGEFPGARTLDSESVLVARALGTRPDLQNLDRQIAAAEEEAQLANAEAWPDLALGVFYEEEEEDKIFLVGLSVPLPLIDRNQGERHRSESAVRRLQAERDAAALSAESEVRRAYSEYEMAKRSVHLYDSEVLLALKESLGLLEKALGAGQIGLPEVILVQREVLDATEGYLSAQLEFAHARARLRAASHQPQTNTEEE